MSSVTPIRVSIPYGMGNALGRAYNTEAAAAEDWFLFLDHDIYVALNPWWYEVCLDAIGRAPANVGWITCYTNRINNKFQVPQGPGPTPPNGDDLGAHRAYAAHLYATNRGKLLDLTETRGCRFSGYFILSRRTVWQVVGGFSENTGGLLHIDVDYYDRLKRAGYRMLLAADLYVYHGYKRDHVKGQTEFVRPER